jgi:hypothetical protein
MIIEYDISIKNKLATMRYMKKRLQSIAYKGVLFYGLSIIMGFSFVFAIASFGKLYDSSSFESIRWINWAIGSIVVGIFSYVILIRVCRKNIERIITGNLSENPTKCHLSINDESLAISDEIGKNVFSRELIKEFDNTKEYFVIIANNYSCISIPKIAFHSEEQLREFEIEFKKFLTP